MREREIVENLRRDLARIRLNRKVSLGLAMVGGAAFCIEAANTHGPTVEGFEAVKLAATFLLTLGSLAYTGLATIAESTLRSAIRYHQYEERRQTMQVPSYNPRINLN